jgi:branched-chain amino acid transport system substrate-binding protein
MIETFKQALGSRAQIRIVETFQPTVTDFRATIGKIKATGNSPLGLFLNPDQLVSFVKQARELGLERPLFGTDLFETAAEIAGPAKLFEGALYPDNDVSTEFRERYRTRYGNQAQLTFAGSGYDMALLMGEILARRPHKIIDELEAVRNQGGVLGRFSFRKQVSVGSFFEYPVVIKAIRGSIGEKVEQRVP